MSPKRNPLQNTIALNLATLGQYGVVQLKTGESSTLEEEFMSFYANEDSTFTVESYTEGGDDSVTIKLFAGGTIPGPYKNITGLTGDILCFKNK